MLLQTSLETAIRNSTKCRRNRRVRRAVIGVYQMPEASDTTSVAVDLDPCSDRGDISNLLRRLEVARLPRRPVPKWILSTMISLETHSSQWRVAAALALSRTGSRIWTSYDIPYRTMNTLGCDSGRLVIAVEGLQSPRTVRPAMPTNSLPSLRPSRSRRRIERWHRQRLISEVSRRRFLGK
jgi:hypothetical protein